LKENHLQASMKFIRQNKKENFVLSGVEKEMAQMFTSIQEMDAFEEAIRLALKKRQDELNMSDDVVGKMAFGFMAGQRTKVQALLVGQGAGKYRKPQRMRTPDLMNLCEALGLKWADVIRDAERATRKIEQTKSLS
jgi:hypothetical protein